MNNLSIPNLNNGDVRMRYEVDLAGRDQKIKIFIIASRRTIRYTRSLMR